MRKNTNMEIYETSCKIDKATKLYHILAEFFEYDKPQKVCEDNEILSIIYYYERIANLIYVIGDYICDSKKILDKLQDI